MKRDRAARVEALFGAALEVPPPQRAAFLATRAETAELHRAVLSLLEAHESRGAFDSLGDWLLGLDPISQSLSFEGLQVALGAGLGGRYRIDREIGRGGMAIVLQAEDLKHGRPVALKVLHPSLAFRIGPDRFLREISIAAKLAHPHILALHDSGEAGGLFYYVMPFVGGESLRDRLRREKRLPLADALKIIREVADALSYAHEQGIVHRDIKPANIMFQAGHAIVADFGIARAMSAAGGNALGESRVLHGTPSYMSPEQARGEQDVDGRSDVYSMACILFEMLSGRPPFTADSMAGILKQHLKERPPALRRLVHDVPDSCDEAVRRALSKTPTDRFPSAVAFAEALVAQQARPPSARRRAVALAVGLCGVAALVVGAFIRSDGSPVH